MPKTHTHNHSIIRVEGFIVNERERRARGIRKSENQRERNRLNMARSLGLVINIC